MMNSIKIEMGAILTIKSIIQMNDYMKDYINDNDKEPSWDGHIYWYESDDLKVESIKYRIPVQIKGKNDASLLKRERISFPVEYKYLRNYYHDGGVFFIVVVISDDRKTSVFYNALTTVKLRSLLKNSESKSPNQTKSIVLEKLKNKDDRVLLKLLSQFGYDREKQGSGNGEIVEKAINIDVIDKVDSVRFTSYVTSNEVETLKKISTGEVCLYGHRADIDMWLPFDYEHQQTIRIKRILKMNKSIGIDGVNYYNQYHVEKTESDIPIVRVSENLTLDLIGGKVHFELHGTISELKKDVDFLRAMSKGHSFWVENKRMSNYSNVHLPSDLEKNMNVIADFYDALEEIDFTCDKRVDDFAEKDWESVVRLIDIHHRKITLKEGRSNEWRMWWWDGKVVPLLIVRNDDDGIEIVNWFRKEEFRIYTEKKTGVNIRLPKGILFKRNIWKNLYDVDEKILLEDIESCDFTSEILDELYLFFVEILSAYDVTKNEKYYDMALLIVTKLLEVDPENENGVVNQLQLWKRKRELSEEEMSRLEKLGEETKNEMIVCAVNILLENKYKAKKLINELSDEEKEMFKNFPIYNLL